jgi:hypothetical protein
VLPGSMLYVWAHCSFDLFFFWWLLSCLTPWLSLVHGMLSGSLLYKTIKMFQGPCCNWQPIQILQNFLLLCSESFVPTIFLFLWFVASLPVPLHLICLRSKVREHSVIGMYLPDIDTRLPMFGRIAALIFWLCCLVWRHGYLWFTGCSLLYKTIKMFQGPCCKWQPTQIL